MKKTLLALIVVMLSGCAVIQSTGLTEVDPTLTTQRAGVKKEFDNIPSPANGKPISVAGYSFADKTGQRRPQANVASLSTAVTQGAETFLIQALQNVGNSQWFDVVERVGIDNLVKERTIIKQMREAYEGNNAKPLMPMQFAGIIMEGGLVGYDSTTTSGGAGMRIFGIGKQTQWSTDTVTVSLRAVSVNTGKVLATITVQKTILSTADSATALKFFDQGTQAFEAEAAEVLAKVRRGEMDRNQMRALASNMVEVSIDAQGRINIEEQLRAYAGLSLNSKVVVSGAFDRVEIWEPLRFGRINTKGTVQIAGADA